MGQLSTIPWQNLTESNTFYKNQVSLPNGLGNPTPTDSTSRLLVLSFSRVPIFTRPQGRCSRGSRYLVD